MQACHLPQTLMWSSPPVQLLCSERPGEKGAGLHEMNQMINKMLTCSLGGWDNIMDFDGETFRFSAGSAYKTSKKHWVSFDHFNIQPSNFQEATETN